MKTTTQIYDFIGDIHGQYGKLNALLLKLAYVPSGEGFRHPEGRKVVFLGDYIDRGPQVREVLLTVRAMVESGNALAIMGNHEFNAVCSQTPDGQGGWLRNRRDAGYLVTLGQFAGREAEWADWLEWMKRLPMALDLGAVRAVHACWDAVGIAVLAGRHLTDGDFLKACATRGTAEFTAVDHVLKGPEMDLPDGQVYFDKGGHERHRVRVRWWDLPAAPGIGEMTMPEPTDLSGTLDPEDLTRLPNYPAEAPPVFFGHYWMKPSKELQPVWKNLACLDYSAASVGPLVAYRWAGEQTLCASKMVAAGGCGNT
jgi:hypothetical protein